MLRDTWPPRRSDAWRPGRVREGQRHGTDKSTHRESGGGIGSSSAWPLMRSMCVRISNKSRPARRNVDRIHISDARATPKLLRTAIGTYMTALRVDRLCGCIHRGLCGGASSPPTMIGTREFMGDSPGTECARHRLRRSAPQGSGKPPFSCLCPPRYDAGKSLLNRPDRRLS